MSNNDNSKKPETLREKEVEFVHKMGERRQRVFERFPLVFTLLGSFGLVATFYGFEGMIDNVEVLADNPYILFGTGVIILVLTGTLYKKLQ